MILLTTLDKQAIVVNAELIEKIESVPETVITLTNNKKILVSDSVEEVVAKVYEYRRRAYGPYPRLRKVKRRMVGGNTW